MRLEIFAHSKEEDINPDNNVVSYYLDMSARDLEQETTHEIGSMGIEVFPALPTQLLAHVADGYSSEALETVLFLTDQFGDAKILDSRGFAYIWEIIVKEPYRSEVYGRGMIRAAREFLRPYGLSYLTAYAVPDEWGGAIEENGVWREDDDLQEGIRLVHEWFMKSGFKDLEIPQDYKKNGHARAPVYMEYHPHEHQLPHGTLRKHLKQGSSW